MCNLVNVQREVIDGRQTMNDEGKRLYIRFLPGEKTLQLCQARDENRKMGFRLTKLLSSGKLQESQLQCFNMCNGDVNVERKPGAHC